MKTHRHFEGFPSKIQTTENYQDGHPSPTSRSQPDQAYILINIYIYILYTYILSATNTDDHDDYDDGGDCDDHDDLNDDGDDDSGSYYDGRVDVCYFIIR